MSGGQLEHGPTPARSSIGFDASGGMHVGRISFAGTWQGTGQRRPLAGINQQPKANQVVLFTPAWGDATPVAAERGGRRCSSRSRAAATNTDLTAPVDRDRDAGGPTAIPPDGAVLVATGTAAAKLQAEAPSGRR